VESLLTSPALIDLIIIFTMIEAVVLIVWCRRNARPPTVSRYEGRMIEGRTAGSAAIGLTLLPGICLLLAVRAALVGAPWPWVPTALTAALVAHLLDLRSRWRG
jgi:hypothetical protein